MFTVAHPVVERCGAQNAWKPTVYPHKESLGILAFPAEPSSQKRRRKNKGGRISNTLKRVHHSNLSPRGMGELAETGWFKHFHFLYVSVQYPIPMCPVPNSPDEKETAGKKSFVSDVLGEKWYHGGLHGVFFRWKKWHTISHTGRHRTDSNV